MSNDELSDLSDENLNDLIDAIKANEAIAREVPTCDFGLYREIVRDIPCPSEEQVEHFVAFVSKAHSWYKHLPLLPPGVSFLFFIDPYSGYDRHLLPDGGVAHKERTDESDQFHYTWMKTSEYRSRFGHLAYEAAAGTKFYTASSGQLQQHGETSIFSTDHTTYRVPVELVREGLAELTAIIHPAAARVGVPIRTVPGRTKPVETTPWTQFWKSVGRLIKTARNVGNATEPLMHCCNQKDDGFIRRCLML